ncbi:hypothetical protein PINS_up010225 [Pythium insidiosum]|nr:hypothetical protein PINS_up010225 [Pythium insidiosum]
MLLAIARLRRATSVPPRSSAQHRWTTAESRYLTSFADVDPAVPRSKRKTRGPDFALLPLALKAFRDAKGHVLVPYHFPIPPTSKTFGHDDPLDHVDWPHETRGMNLGRTLHAFMVNPDHHLRHPQIMDALAALGVPQHIEWKRYVWEKVTMAALRTFRKLHGHTFVHNTFVVPRGDAAWPRATWGHRLGAQVNRLRQSAEQLDAHELSDLRSVDFAFHVFDTVWSERILPSIEVYAREHGDCFIPNGYIVPSEKPWPEKAWGLKLGMIINGIRSRGIYSEQIERDAARLEAVGFVWKVREDKWKTIVLPSLEAFAQQFGHCRVPRMFCVPSEAPWPQRAWGFQLGVCVNHMRSNSQYVKELEEDAARLKEIGFVWDHRRDRWSRAILPSLEVFAQLHGTSRVPRSFVVPSEAPWPETAWGLALGIAARDIRNANAYREHVAQDEARLSAIGFWDTIRRGREPSFRADVAVDE